MARRRRREARKQGGCNAGGITPTDDAGWRRSAAAISGEMLRDRPPIGSGRNADVFAYTPDKVLRRYREPRDTAREAAAMEHARRHGFPTPVAHALNDRDIVMDRVSGRDMLDDLLRRPWLLPRHAGTLAELHDRLHAIEAPHWLPAPLGDGAALLHLDLHPENVILSEEGPVVIDWNNAARGPGEADVAMTWLILACSLPPKGGLRKAASIAGRRLFLALFLRHFEGARIENQLDSAGSYRLATRAIPSTEVVALSRYLERLGAAPS
jgi:aminoglycoside phosphotransferase (APT) family kinase protein